MTLTLVLPSQEEIDRIAAYPQVYVDELKAAFDKVADPADWKNPIHAIVTGDHLKITLDAIDFYTATQATVKALNPGIYYVYSIGYRAGPAGDH